MKLTICLIFTFHLLRMALIISIIRYSKLMEICKWDYLILTNVSHWWECICLACSASAINLIYFTLIEYFVLRIWNQNNATSKVPTNYDDVRLLCENSRVYFYKKVWLFKFYPVMRTNEAIWISRQVWRHSRDGAKQCYNFKKCKNRNDEKFTSQFSIKMLWIKCQN